MNGRCEWKEHKGDPKKNLGHGTWLMKFPECVWLCPNCAKEDFKKKLLKELNKDGN